MSAGDRKREPRVAIIGAGLGGISTAIALQQQLHFTNFIIYEKENSVGGTWRDNTYPGCGSDVPGHWYSLSTELNPYWTSYYVGQPELQEYWVRLWHKHNLESSTQFNTQFKSAVWDHDAQLYRLVLEDVKTGVTTEVEAEAVFFAIGGFLSPNYPREVGGRESFKGAMWHSARWDHTVDLAGKRVGVIGNGCSAAQFVPKIAADPSVQIINFCRTPQWYVPPHQTYRYPRWVKVLFAYVPFTMRLYRNFLMARSDASALAFSRENKFIVKQAEKGLSRYIRHKAPKDMVEQLVPSYPPGCKRIIVDPGYLGALHKANVALRWDAIDSVVEEGIKMKSGELVPLDVIIFGTGYELGFGTVDVEGTNGRRLGTYYEERGGPVAYLGTCVPGFPNAFHLLGPNTATGHASVIFTEEAQINLALQLLKPVLDGKAKSFEATDKATDGYNDWLQSRLSTSVWTECHSYYHRSRSETKSKIIATFPGPVSLFWWMTRTPRWGDYKAVGADAWFKTLQRRKIRKLVLLFVGVGLGLWWSRFRMPAVELFRRVLKIMSRLFS